MKKTKILLSFIIILLMASFETKGQNPGKILDKLSFGTSLGIGYINPKQINEYINDYYDSDVGIHLALSLDINVSYFVTEKVEVKGVLLGALAYTVQDYIGYTEDKFTILTRLSPEIIANYHYPINNYNSIYFGGGVSYNKLSFNMDLGSEGEMSGKTPGLLLNAGLLSKTGKHNKYMELVVNLINAKSNYFQNYESAKSEMNFSGVTLNFGIRF